MPTSQFLARAQAGEPVYLTEVRAAYSQAATVAQICCEVTGIGNETRTYQIPVPDMSGLAPAEQDFVIDYFLACLYNIVSTVGARQIRLTGGNPADCALLTARFAEAFGLEAPRAARRGYGRSVNVAERMVDAVDGHDGSRLTVLTTAAHAAEDPPASDSDNDGSGVGLSGLGRCARDLAGLNWCGVDVGGTDIKAVVVLDGQLVAYKEYDWFPAQFDDVDQLINPILCLVQLLRLSAIATLSQDAALAAVLAPALEPTAGDELMAAAVAQGHQLAAGATFGFDGIGMCFPDVVVANKIVGGEVYKVRGIRAAHPTDFDMRLRALSNLDVLLGNYLAPDGVVAIVNDGPMAAFTAAVEHAAIDETSVAQGVFAHTLGTELGTGWVTETGAVPDIPLEFYNCIIDLGSHPERAYPPDDLRSVRNFNTNLPGTLQKYASQSGVFRLAMKYLPNQDAAMFQELLQLGLIQGDAQRGYLVPTSPVDQRKPLLEYFMSALERDGHPVAQRIFTEIGHFLAIAYLESAYLLAPATHVRVQFGRLVKHPRCFAAMVAGAAAIAPQVQLTVADETLAVTPLMRQLANHPHYTVAQFAQAVGAVHWANAVRHNRDERPVTAH